MRLSALFFMFILKSGSPSGFENAACQRCLPGPRISRRGFRETTGHPPKSSFRDQLVAPTLKSGTPASSMMRKWSCDQHPILDPIWARTHILDMRDLGADHKRHLLIAGASRKHLERRRDGLKDRQGRALLVLLWALAEQTHAGYLIEAWVMVRMRTE